MKKTIVERVLDFLRPLFGVPRFGTGIKDGKTIQPWTCKLGLHYWSTWFGSIRLEKPTRCYLCGLHKVNIEEE